MSFPSRTLPKTIVLFGQRSSLLLCRLFSPHLSLLLKHLKAASVDILKLIYCYIVEVNSPNPLESWVIPVPAHFRYNGATNVYPVVEKKTARQTDFAVKYLCCNTECIQVPEPAGCHSGAVEEDAPFSSVCHPRVLLPLPVKGKISIFHFINFHLIKFPSTRGGQGKKTKCFSAGRECFYSPTCDNFLCFGALPLHTHCGTQKSPPREATRQRQVLVCWNPGGLKISGFLC